jgi:hypothetical protein
VILDLARFVELERPLWQEFEKVLGRFEQDAMIPMTLDEVARFHYLYERSSSDLARIATFAADPHTREYLESLVARGYAEINSRDYAVGHFRPLSRFWHWITRTVPQTFRRHFREFLLCVVLTAGGSAFGAAAIHFDPDSKGVLMPFQQLMQSPAERVRREETATTDRMRDVKTSFSA